MIDQELRQESTNRSAEPPVIVGARYFLCSAIFVWSVGTLVSALDVWRSFASSTLRTGPAIALLVWRATLLSTAFFAYRGVRRRRPSGRWLTVALASLACYLTIPAVVQGWRAFFGDYRPASGLIPYSSREDAVIATGVVVVMLMALVVLAQQLAAGRRSAQYFADDDRR